MKPFGRFVYQEMGDMLVWFAHPIEHFEVKHPKS